MRIRNVKRYNLKQILKTFRQKLKVPLYGFLAIDFSGRLGKKWFRVDQQQLVHFDPIQHALCEITTFWAFL